MRPHLDIATLLRTKGLNGGLVAKPATGLSFLLSEGLELALVPPVLDAPRKVTVASMARLGNDEALINFEEVEDITTASLLVGCHCLARRCDLDLQNPQSGQDCDEWVGLTVYDETADRIVGTVSAIEHRPLQWLAVIDNGEGREILVPIVEEFILEVDEEGRLVVTLPPGLTDL